MEFALRFRSDLVDLIEQNRRHSSVMLRILRLKIDQRWPEDEMQNRGIIPLRVLSQILLVNVYPSVYGIYSIKIENLFNMGLVDDSICHHE